MRMCFYGVIDGEQGDLFRYDLLYVLCGESMNKGYYLQLVPYYAIIMLQRLSFVPSDDVSGRAGILRSLAGILYKKYSQNKKKRKEYEKKLEVLAKIELKGKLLTNYIRELEYEIYYGNVFSLDSKFTGSYVELMKELSILEAEIINDLQQVLGEQLPVDIFIPSMKR